jgi:hypothetical protein
LGERSGTSALCPSSWKENISFWGPTDPVTRLQEFADVDVATEVYYPKTPCSPCLHMAEPPSCEGENICFKTIFQQEKLTVIKNKIIKINKQISE